MSFSSSQRTARPRRGSVAPPAQPRVPSPAGSTATRRAARPRPRRTGYWRPGRSPPTSQKENATLQSAVEIAQRVVDSDREKLDRIKTDLAAKTISLENAQVQAAFIRRNTAQIAAILDDARKQRDSFLTARKGLQDSDTTAVDREIGEYQTKIALLESQLASVNAALTLTELN